MLETGLIDPDEPVCLLLVALLHFMPDETKPEIPLEFYRRRLPPGSLLVLSHGHVDPSDTATIAAVKEFSEAYKAQATRPIGPRWRDEIEAFFGDFQLVDPGLVWLPQWRPDDPEDEFLQDPPRSRGLAGVARKA